MKRIVFLFVASVLLMAPFAQANTIGTLTLVDCGGGVAGCPAGSYSFNIGTTSASLTITIASNAVLNSNNNVIGAVNLGFVAGNGNTPVFSNLSVVGPTVVNPSWTATTGTLSNSCNSNANSPFICTYASNYGTVNNQHGGVSIVAGGTYTWTWTYNAISAGSIFAVGNVHVGADYNPNNGLIVSQTGATSVPEPSSLLLMGSGLLGLAGLYRRRSK